MKIKCLESSNKDVKKYIFEKEDAIMEAVLYKYGSYEERTVICCSIQSGCPVGCVFCGTGKRFIRNLTVEEIVGQVSHMMEENWILHATVKKFQIMFMSMGEPMLNVDNLVKAIRVLNEKYPNAELLISTIGVEDRDAMNKIITVSEEIDKVGLQFSIHESTDEKRSELIPFKNKMKLNEIRDFGTYWFLKTGRTPYLNYCVTEKNNTEQDYKNMVNLFSPIMFNLTFSVVCTADETLKDVYKANEKLVRDFTEKFTKEGYSTRVFNPAGQDDIGGGCGQLWHVQDWMKKHKK